METCEITTDLADIADALISRRADLEVVNSVDKGGLTPLLAAIEYGHISVIRVLLKAGEARGLRVRSASAIAAPCPTASC